MTITHIEFHKVSGEQKTSGSFSSSPSIAWLSSRYYGMCAFHSLKVKPKVGPLFLSKHLSLIVGLSS